ncbi:MAG TPA: hypothetical protein PKN36_03290 [bacterium]|nr:hypothetical protein [bacterium]
MKNLTRAVMLSFLFIPFLSSLSNGQVSENVTFKVIPELSYYTVEKNVRVKYSGPSPATGMILKIFDSEGRIIAVNDGKRNEAVFPAEKLAEGKNVLRAELIGSDGNFIYSTIFQVTKLPPLVNGIETKVDHFRRIVLRGGKPFFPFGVYNHSTSRRAAYADTSDTAIKDRMYRRITNAGMNTVVLTVDTSNEKTDWKEAELYVQDAQKYGLLFGHWDVLRSLIYMGRFSKTLDDPEGLGKEKNEAKEIFTNKMLPSIEKIVSSLRNYPNFLFYYGADECNYGNYKLNVYVQKLYYDVIKKLDPYHVVFGVYARVIPPIDDTLDYFDVLGYDVYTYPNWGRNTSLICDSMAVHVSQLDRRCAEKDMPVWMVPLGNSIDCNRTPRFLTDREQVCQTYTAMIYGAKGLIYFNNDLILGRSMWNTFKTLREQVKAMEPALLNYPVKQDITYDPGVFIPDEWKCPDVHAKLFKFPDGDYLLLTVNGRDYPVLAYFLIPGLTSARRIFIRPGAVKITGAVFQETFDNYGVAAYRLKIKPPSDGSEIKITVDIKSQPELENKIPINGKLIKEAANRKNHVLNPSFEMERKIEWMPDFYFPHNVLEIDEIGEKASRWFLDTKNPMFGKYSLRMQMYPLTEALKRMKVGVYARYGINSREKGIHTFSLYARSAKSGDRLSVRITEKEGAWKSKTFNLTENWERYSFNFEITGEGTKTTNKLILIQLQSGDSTVWIDGLQFEKGEEATEFSEN